MLILLLVFLLGTGSAEAKERPCQTLRFEVVSRTLNYALERSSSDELATVPDMDVEIEVANCARMSPDRARWSYSIVGRAERAAPLLSERGYVTVSKRRATFAPVLKGVVR